jgi:hypothetical protein
MNMDHPERIKDLGIIEDDAVYDDNINEDAGSFEMAINLGI